MRNVGQNIGDFFAHYKLAIAGGGFWGVSLATATQVIQLITAVLGLLFIVAQLYYFIKEKKSNKNEKINS